MFFQVYTDVQLRIAGLSLLLGVILGGLFEVFRIMRLLFFRGMISVIVQDVLFWTISGYAVFLHTLALNYGEVRMYILLLVLAGFLIYYFTLGSLIFFIVKSLSDRIRRALKKAKNAAAAKCRKAVKKAFAFAISKSGKINIKKRKKPLEIDE